MPVNRGSKVAVIVWVFLPMTWVTVSLRCYVRAVKKKSFGADDWLAIISLVFFTLYCTFVLLSVTYGIGRRDADLGTGNLSKAFKWWWFAEVMYASSTAIFKVSIGVFLLRVFTQKVQIYVIWAVMVVIMAFSTFFTFLIIFQCYPVSFFWMRFEGASGKCISQDLIANFAYAHSALSAVSDWILGIFPIFLVWNLKMNFRTKILVALFMGLGTFGSLATVVRIPYLQQLKSTSDFLNVTVDVAIWSTIEPGIGITCAAVACCRPLFRNNLSRTYPQDPSFNSDNTGYPQHRSQNDLSHGRNMRTDDIAFVEEVKQRHKNENTKVVASQIGRKDTGVEMDIITTIEKKEITENLKSGNIWLLSDTKLADNSSDDWPLITSRPSGQTSVV